MGKKEVEGAQKYPAITALTSRPVKQSVDEHKVTPTHINTDL